MDVTEIIDAFYANDLEKVTAASLSRVLDLVGDLKTNSFGIITPWRAGLSLSENRGRLKQLEQELRRHGFGFFKLIGHWVECQDDVPYEECPPDQLMSVKEPSLFVPKISLALIHKLGKKYDQDAVVYGGPDAGGKTVLVFKNGRKEPIGTLSPKAISNIFSELASKRGRHFSFASYAPTGVVEARAAITYEDACYSDARYVKLSKV